MSHGEMEQLIL